MTTTMTMGLCCVHSCAPRWGLLQKTTPLLCLSSSSIPVLSLHISSKNQQLRVVCLCERLQVYVRQHDTGAHTQFSWNSKRLFIQQFLRLFAYFFFYERLNVTFFISAQQLSAIFLGRRKWRWEPSLAGLGSSLSVIFSRECVCGKQWNLLVENLIVLIKKRRVKLTLMELY